MCTVSYIPTHQGFILTHNRDEAPTRSPAGLSEEGNDYRNILFPRDTKAGGTWIVADDSGNVACLLNGAFIKHKHEPPYRRSRGLILMDGLKAVNPLTFWETYDYTGIEPFTLLYFSFSIMREIRWDGQQIYVKHLPTDQPRFWCSATLYPPEMQQRRERVFADWLLRNKHHNDAEALLNLHRTGSVGDPENDFVMNRQERVRTVSITQIQRAAKDATMRYNDLLHEQEDVRSITFKAEINALNMHK